MAYIGVDIGTTGCKCMAFGNDMEALSEAYFEYPMIYGKNGEIEQNPDDWWLAVKTGISEVASGIDGIRSIGISSQGITFVPVDKSGIKLTNAISWLDMRALDQCDAIETSFGRDNLYKLTGKKSNQAYTLPKLMWMKANMPDIYQKTYKFLLAHDYIINKLCGAFVTEDSLAAGTMAYDIKTKTWDEIILDSAGIDCAKLPEIMKSGSMAGVINKDAARELGVPEDIIITIGGQDQKCAAYGAGIEYGNITVSLGTSSAITALFDKPVVTEDMSLPCFPFIDGINWVLEGFCSTAGASVKWYRDNLGNGKNYKEIDAGIEKEYHKLPASGLMFFPYLEGTSTPEWFSEGSGAFFGIGLETSEAMLAAAVLEGTAFNIRANIEKIESLGKSCKEIIVFGGGSNSKIWLRIIADSTGKTVRKTKIEETACLGAAMKAAEAVENKRFDIKYEYQDIKPDMARHHEYNEKYRKYKNIEKRIYNRGIL